MVKLLVYGGSPTRDNTMAQSALELTSVDDDVAIHYAEQVQKCETRDDLLKVFRSLVSENINIVSMDGYRVFNASKLLSILEYFEGPEGKERYLDPLSTTLFNRTLGIRQKVAQLFCKQ